MVVAFFSSLARAPSVSTAQTLAMMLPPVPTSEVTEANSNWSVHRRCSRARYQSLPWPCATMQATWIWCMAKIIAADAQDWPSVWQTEAT
jgi:hypothetical protein